MFKIKIIFSFIPAVNESDEDDVIFDCLSTRHCNFMNSHLKRPLIGNTLLNR